MKSQRTFSTYCSQNNLKELHKISYVDLNQVSLNEIDIASKMACSRGNFELFHFLLNLDKSKNLNLENLLKISCFHQKKKFIDFLTKEKNVKFTSNLIKDIRRLSQRTGRLCLEKIDALSS